MAKTPMKFLSPLDAAFLYVEKPREAMHIGSVMVYEGRIERDVARVYGGMLDRRHPLWKLIILHGLPDDHTAVVWKVHHAMVDGVSGIDLTMALHDFRPDAEPPAPPAQPWQPPPIPDPLTLLQQAVEHTMTRTTRSLTEAAFDLFRPDGMAARA